MSDGQNPPAFVPPPKDDPAALEIEFAKAALAGVLADPHANPQTPERATEVCNFCWYMAQEMVRTRPTAAKPAVRPAGPVQ